MPKAGFLKCYFGCVLNCSLHRFPKWEYPHTEKFNQWKSILDPTTQEKGNKYIFNSIRICDRHFEKNFRLPSRRLTLNAVPTLFTSSQQMEEDVVPPLQLQPVQEDHEVESETIDLQQNSDELDFEMPSTSSSPSVPVLSISNLTQQLEIVAPGTPKRRIWKRKESAPQKVILRLKERIKKLRIKCKMLRKQLAKAKNSSMSQSVINKAIEKLPDAAQVFLKLQLKGINKPKGRRFTDTEKIMALTILKESPKAYSLLKNMFVLPSIRCLQKPLSECETPTNVTGD